MKKINQEKEFERFVLESITTEISQRTGRSKKEAHVLLINALACNIVAVEILKMVDWLVETEKGAAA